MFLFYFSPSFYIPAIYHHWIYIILGILMINSIPVIIAINVFITVRQRFELLLLLQIVVYLYNTIVSIVEFDIFKYVYIVLKLRNRREKNCSHDISPLLFFVETVYKIRKPVKRNPPGTYVDTMYVIRFWGVYAEDLPLMRTQRRTLGRIWVD